jgi:PAS domain-containing protein
MIQLVEFMPSGEYLTDITRKEMEESRARSDKFFTMSSEMMIIASSTHFIKINPAAIKILGYTEEELLEQPFSTSSIQKIKTILKVKS